MPAGDQVKRIPIAIGIKNDPGCE